MKHICKIVVLLGIILAVNVLAGCSGGDVTTAVDEGRFSTPVQVSDSARMLWGVWDVRFDPDGLTATVETSRDAQAHFNVTGMLLPPDCDDCVEIAVNSFDPVTRILDVDVTLRNPTLLTAFDVRGILYTNDYGHRLCNADSWTSLWDVPGGMPINPFKAFAKDNSYQFSADTEHTENYQIYIPMPPHYADMTYAVDVSFPVHCVEPYAICNFWADTITDEIGSAGNVIVTVYDRGNDVNSVLLRAPEITGDNYSAFVQQDDYRWMFELVNNAGASAGEYEVWVIATSLDSGGLELFDVHTITVGEGTGELNPIDVTPDGLNFTPWKLDVMGDYACVSGRFNGLHIFDITDPASPSWTGWVDIPGDTWDVAVQGEYIFTAADTGGLWIIDANPPWSPDVVKIVDTPGRADGVDVSGGYAYVTDWEKALHIIDIDPIETAHIVKTVNLGKDVLGVTVDNGYAYVCGHMKVTGWYIIDVDPPGDAAVVHSSNEPKCVYDIEVEDGLAYLTTGTNLSVFDISSPGSPVEIKTVPIANQSAWRVSIDGGYAYVTSTIGIQIVDIDPIDTASIINTVSVNSYGDVFAAGGYVYNAPRDRFQVIDVDPPESAFLAGRIFSAPSFAKLIDEDEGYTYVTDTDGFISIIDSNPPESSVVVKQVWTTDGFYHDYSYDLVADNGMAYLLSECASNEGWMSIVDVSPPETAVCVNVLPLVQPTHALCVDGGYAYASGHQHALRIFDIDPPESAGEIGSITDDVEMYCIAVAGGYALAPVAGGLAVMDVDPPESAYVVKVLDSVLNCCAIHAEGGYAYCAGPSEIYIVDIEPMESAHLVNQIDAPAIGANAMDVENGYACVAYDFAGIYIYDVDPPESAHYVETIPTREPSTDVAMGGGYAYISMCPSDYW